MASKFVQDVNENRGLTGLEGQATTRVAAESARLNELEVEAIEMFINFLKLLGLPKSVGEIYGLLFVSSRALAMDEIMGRLEISLGAASQGLKLLRNLGAVKVVYEPGNRRDHYVADLELSKFATVFIREELEPMMERATARLARMRAVLPTMAPEEKAAAEIRIARLQHWLDKGRKMLPWVLAFLVK